MEIPSFFTSQMFVGKERQANVPVTKAGESTSEQSLFFGGYEDEVKFPE